MKSKRILQLIFVGIFASSVMSANIMNVLSDTSGKRGAYASKYGKDGPITFYNNSTELEKKIEKIEGHFQELIKIKDGQGFNNEIVKESLPLRKFADEFDTTPFVEETTIFDQSEVDILFGLQPEED